jgi:hypothetical protein
VYVNAHKPPCDMRFLQAQYISAAKQSLQFSDMLHPTPEISLMRPGVHIANNSSAVHASGSMYFILRVGWLVLYL